MSYKIKYTKFGKEPDYIRILERIIGRPVRRNEVVHHIDLDKTNDDPNP